MASFSKVGIRPISPLDPESLHVDLNDPCRAAFTSVHNYFLGRYFLVHMAEKISVARETTELGLFCHVGNLEAAGELDSQQELSWVGLPLSLGARHIRLSPGRLSVKALRWQWVL